MAVLVQEREAVPGTCQCLLVSWTAEPNYSRACETRNPVDHADPYRCRRARPFRLRASACLSASQGHPVTLALASQGPQSLSLISDVSSGQDRQLEPGGAPCHTGRCLLADLPMSCALEPAHLELLRTIDAAPPDPGGGPAAHPNCVAPTADTHGVEGCLSENPRLECAAPASTRYQL